MRGAVEPICESFAEQFEHIRADPRRVRFGIADSLMGGVLINETRLAYAMELTPYIIRNELHASEFSNDSEYDPREDIRQLFPEFINEIRDWSRWVRELPHSIETDAEPWADFFDASE
jgi:hypothetical protein